MAVNFLMSKVSELEKKINNENGLSAQSGTDEKIIMRIVEIEDKIEMLERNKSGEILLNIEDERRMIDQKTRDSFEVVGKKIDDLEKALERERISHIESSKQLHSKINALEKKLSTQSPPP